MCYVATPAGEWICISDSHVQAVTPKQVLACEAYLLFYTRVDGVDALPAPPASVMDGALLPPLGENVHVDTLTAEASAHAPTALEAAAGGAKSEASTPDARVYTV